LIFEGKYSILKAFFLDPISRRKAKTMNSQSRPVVS